MTVAPPALTVPEGEEKPYTVVLATEPTEDVAVSVTVPGSTDVTASPTAMTFTSTNWDDEQTVTVSAGEDPDAVADDPVTLTHAVSSGGDYGGESASSVTVTITENDTPVLSMAAQSAVESAGSLAFPVTLSVASSKQVTVDYATANGTATAGSDYTAASGSLTFAANSTGAQTISVTLTDDQVDETNETFTVTLSNAEHATLSGDGTTLAATGTITDDDVRGVTVAPTALTVPEGDEKPYTVVLTSQPTADVEVSVTVPGSTDVTVDETVLTFTASTWETAQTVTVSADQDDDGEDDEVTLTHAVSGGDYGSVTAASVTVTVDDDETASDTVTLAVDPATVAENVGAAGQAVEVTASLDAAPLTSATEVTVTVSGGTATAGSDFAAVTDLALTIAMGESSGTGTFTLQPVNDAVSEGAETVAVSGTASGLTVTGAAVTIGDDEALPTVTLALGSTTIGENGGSTAVTASLDHGSSAETTITVSVTPVAPATSGDYTLSSNRVLTIAAGATTSTGAVTITAVDNAVDAADKRVTVSGAASNTVGVTAPGNQTLTIGDDDARGVTVAPPALTVPEGEEKPYTVVLDTQPTEEVAVSVTVPGSTDVTVDETALTFTSTNWATAQTVTVSAAEDPDAVADDPVTLTHAVSSGGDYSGETAADVTVTITENDTPVLSMAAQSATESAGTLAFPVTLSVASSKQVTVDYATANDTATAGSDYTAASGSLTFAADSTDAQTISVTLSDDRVDEADETFTVTLGNAEHATLSGDGTTLAATGTITDDDTRGVTVAPTALTVTEGADEPYTVVLDTQPTADVEVSVTVPGATDVMASPTALTFTASTWETVQTVTVSAGQDDDGQDDEVTLTHAVSSSGDYSGASASSVTVTVSDDETASDTVVLTVDPATVAENVGSSGKAVEVTGTLNEAPRASDTEVTVTVAGGTATVATDFAAVTGFTLTIDTGQTSGTGTFTLKPVNDAVSEGDETVAVSGSASGLTVTAAAVTIGDDEALPTVTLALDSAAIGENGGSTAVTASLDHASSAETTITVSVTPVSPATGSDYTLSSNRVLTIAAGATTSTGEVTVTAVDNAVDAADKTVTVSATAGNTVGVTNPDSKTLTIGDDDGRGVTVAPTALTVPEGDEKPYTVVLASQPTADVAVSVTVPGSTDVTAGPTALTFTSTNWDEEQTVTVSAGEDPDAVADDPVTLTHAVSSSGDYGSETASVTVTITEDDTAAAALTLVFPAPAHDDQDSSGDVTLGDVLTYTATATNSGNVPLANVTVKDLLVNTGGESCATLALEESCELSGDHTVTQADVDAGQVVNTATATADGLSDQTVTRTTTVALAAEQVDQPELSVAAATGSEQAGTVEFAVALSAASLQTVSVAYTSTDGSTNAGTDYVAASGRLTLAPSTTRGTISVQVVDDSVVEGSESFTLALTSASNATVASDGAAATGIITDNDQASYAVAVSDAAIAEDGGASTVTVSTGGVSFPAAQTFTLTFGGTATKGTDYTVGAERLTLSVGQSSVATTVTAAADAVDEANETVTVGALLGGSEVGTRQTITITDDDARGVTVAPTALTVPEGGEKPYTVVLASQPTAAVAVGVTVPPSSDVSASPTALTFTPGTWARAQTVTVSAAQDGDAADDEVTLAHAVSGGDYGGVTVAAVTVTVTDDDEPNRAPTASDGTVRTDEDTTYVFRMGDFNFMDGDAGDRLERVKIVTVPAVGTLRLRNGAVQANDEVNRGDLVNWQTPLFLDHRDSRFSDKLKYTPAANGNGEGYASFTFRVSDGEAESASVYTMMIDVSAVNDAATGAPEITGTARAGQTLTAVIGDVADVDGMPEHDPNSELLPGAELDWQWVRVDGSAPECTTAGCRAKQTEIEDATSKTYALAAADVGKQVRVKVSFADQGGTRETRASAVYPARGRWRCRESRRWRCRGRRRRWRRQPATAA